MCGYVVWALFERLLGLLQAQDGVLQLVQRLVVQRGLVCEALLYGVQTLNEAFVGLHHATLFAPPSKDAHLCADFFCRRSTHIRLSMPHLLNDRRDE